MSQSLDHVFQTDFNRAISAQFAPSEKRRGLRLLCALDAELAKIPHQTTEPMLRRIRTQFLREALFKHDGAGHALAKDLIDCFSGDTDLFASLDKLILVHEKSQDLDTSSKMEWGDYCERQAVMFELACDYLLGHGEEMSKAFYQGCGNAYGGALFLCTQRPLSIESEEVINPLRDQTQTVLGEVLVDLQELNPSARAAVLPIALARPYLNLFQASDRADGLPIDLHPVQKSWVLWRALRKGFN